MTEQTNLLAQFSELLNQNVNGTEIGVYSIAVAGLALAFRNVKAFSRFCRPSDIPNRFISSRTKLRGVVERVEPNGALLMVKHKPLIGLPFFKAPSLPVQIVGVNVNGHGISWLQSIVSEHEIVFVPIVKKNNCVQCEVTLPQRNMNNQMNTLKIGPALVSVGFAELTPVEKSLTQNPFYYDYYKQLKAAELRAYRKQLGSWYYLKATQNITQKIAAALISLISSKWRRTVNVVTA